jgi:hypothetical protein
MTYAAKTTVSTDKTRVEIEKLLRKSGATRIGVLTEPRQAGIVFVLNNLHIKFVLPLPDPKAPKADQRMRTAWRGLFLCIKAKMESVTSGIETFEESFLAHVMTPDGTIYEHLRPRLVEIAKGTALPLLTGPHP